MAPGSTSVAELFSDGLDYLKSSPAPAVLGDRPSSIVVDRPQHVACLLLADRFIDAFNRNNPFSHKHRTVFLYARDLPIVNIILTRSLL
jgi:hypothetical protein